VSTLINHESWEALVTDLSGHGQTPETLKVLATDRGMQLLMIGGQLRSVAAAVMHHAEKTAKLAEHTAELVKAQQLANRIAYLSTIGEPPNSTVWDKVQREVFG
jgi:hypothetical protein